MYLPACFSGPHMEKIHLTMDSWVPFPTMSSQADFILLGYPRSLEQGPQDHIRDKTAFGGKYILQSPLSHPHKSLGMITIGNTCVMFLCARCSSPAFLPSVLPIYLPIFCVYVNIQICIQVYKHVCMFIHIDIHLILIITLSGEHCYPYFTDYATEGERG